MTTFASALRKWELFNPIETAGKVMLEEKEQIIDVNREQLYEHGIGKDGVALPPYSPPYAKIKMKQRGKSIVDIYRKGTLQNEMELVVEGQEYNLFSKVPYAQYVVGKRPTIFGLTTDGKKITWGIIHDGFVRELKEVTGAG